MNRIASWAAPLLLLLLPSLAPAAATFITLSSDPGDPMGATLAGAAPQPFTNTNGTITVVANPRGGFSVHFAPTPAAENLQLDFGPLAGQQFTTGRYEIPLRFPTAPPNRPALEVYRDGFRCSVIAGRFIVRELVFASNGSLQSLAIDFEQHCDSNVPALHGAVRFNSDAAYVPEALARSVTGDTPGAPVTLSVTAPDRPCALLETQFVDVGDAKPVAFPYGIIAFRAAGCDPLVSAATFTMQFVQPPTGNVVLWKFGPTPDDVFAHWYTIPITVVGDTVSFTIADGGLGDDDLTANGIIQSYGGITVGGIMQDMWWVPAENGWGMSIEQHGAALFNVIYMYDAGGKATWLAMSGGAWAGPYTSYTGPLYRPRGAPYYAFDSARVFSGPAVGTATITFIDMNNARLDYTIDGVSGTKNITRQLFGPPGTAIQGRGDMYWGGPTQNGWGIAVLQQNASLFSVWFTYDANGAPTWFVMPAGTWFDDATYTGNLYATTGSPWLGHTYDPHQLRVTNVGTFSLHFDQPTGTFDYTAEGHKGTLSIVSQPF